MPKLTVQLTQHTPILQFHAENGAGLRGTELKPALDRFLLRHCPVPREWLQPNSDEDVRALQYRVKIVESTNKQQNERSTVRQVGVMLSTSQKKGQSGIAHEVMMGSAATVTFLTAHSGLLTCLKVWIGAFFACHNFGYQKNKGFGCYTVASIDNEPYQTSIEQDLKKALGQVYELNPENLDNANSWQLALKRAAEVRKEMKTGISKKPSPTSERIENPFLFKSVRQGKGWRTFLIPRELSRNTFDNQVYFLSECILYRNVVNRWIAIKDEKEYVLVLREFLALLTTFKEPRPRWNTKGRLIQPVCRYPLLREVK